MFGNAWNETVLKGKQFFIGETSFGSYPGTGGGGVGWTSAQATTLVQQTIEYLDGRQSGTTTVEAVAWFETNKSDGDWRLSPAYPDALTAWSLVSSR